ncbi:MAG: Uma2 family endonuclease [Deltaproteobacteria bacterium]|nr:Uma2 family endonuclease [Deltaproteobacteria bacterium]
MVAVAPLFDPWSPPPRELREPGPDADARVILRGVDWWQYETILAIRGDRAGVRIHYLEGELEIMSPARGHEGTKKAIARLVEAYADELAIELNGYGSLTMRSAPKLRGAEPDECYVLGKIGAEDRVDIAIEVIWTSGGLDKLDIYRGLGTKEVWFWNEGAIEIHALRGNTSERIKRSELLPELDFKKLTSFLNADDQSGSVRAYRAWLRKRLARRSTSRSKSPQSRRRG